MLQLQTKRSLTVIVALGLMQRTKSASNDMKETRNTQKMIAENTGGLLVAMGSSDIIRL